MEIDKNLSSPITALLCQASPFGVLISDYQEGVLYINPFFENMLGWTSEEVKNRKVEVLVPEFSQLRHRQERGSTSPYEKTPLGSGHILQGLHKNGSSIPIEIGLYPLEINNENYLLVLALDSTEKKELEEQKTLSSSIIDTTTNGMVIVNNKGEITFANNALCSIFGYNHKELIGSAIEIFIDDELKETHRIRRTEYLKDPKPVKLKAHRKIAGCHKDGSKVPVEVTLSPLNIEGETHVLATVHNLTDRVRAEKEAQEVQKAFAINKTRSQTLQMVAHDLRSPLTAVIESLNLLNSGHVGQLTKEQEEILTIAERESNLLLGFINDLLDASILESKELHIHKEMHDINNLLNNSIQAFRPLIEKKGLTFNTQLLDHKYPISIDPKRIIQAVNNLLSNAIKYTEKGFIGLEIREKEGGVLIQVKDSGLGIEPKTLENLFDRKAYDQPGKFDSHGLGLYITKQLIDMHQGTLSVESVAGEGSTFTIFLPKET